MAREDVSNILYRIKRCALGRRVDFTAKARNEMWRDCLTEDDVIESLLSAHTIHKTIKSTSASRQSTRERLYVIQSTSFRGEFVYTKGKLVVESGIETYYLLISAKQSVYDGD
jgi:hypothetical protein